MKKITVVIPALNEEQGIGLVLKEIPVSKLMNMGYEIEVMVVDNGSKDKTSHIARQHGATVLIQPIRGYGNAYKAGFANASGDIIATGDADHTYPFEDLPEMIEKMEKEDLDFISTNRLKHINPEVMTPSHIFGNRLLTAITKILFNLPFVDTQSGMWIFRREIWDELDVRSSGMAFSQELKIEAYIRGFKCAEVPIKYRIRAGVAKLNTLKDGTKVMFRIFHKRLSTLFLKNTSGGKERVSIFEDTGSEPLFHPHIDEKNVFLLNSAEGFAASILGDESGMQERLSPPEREVYSEKLFSKITLKDGASQEKQTVLEYLNGDL
ncbi:MAG TPA: glycosyltransferase family 2 protein [Ktedonobacteraceae bacterium]|nr:glycosyltransferase family 2 protein [Ktedonobacteraceae bacterium]